MLKLGSGCREPAREPVSPPPPPPPPPTMLRIGVPVRPGAGDAGAGEAVVAVGWVVAAAVVDCGTAVDGAAAAVGGVSVDGTGFCDCATC